LLAWMRTNRNRKPAEASHTNTLKFWRRKMKGGMLDKAVGNVKIDSPELIEPALETPEQGEERLISPWAGIFCVQH
jgi:hypothetical protein